MNHYTLAEMTPGLSESFTVTVTEEMMARFEAITGDVSPIHIDAEYAQKARLPRPRGIRHAGCQLFLHPGGRYLPANTACYTAWSASSPMPVSYWGIL